MNIDKAKVVKAKTKKVLGVLITYCILVIVACFLFFTGFLFFIWWVW